MKQFSAQFHRFQKTTQGDNLITFRVDRMYSKDISELVAMDTGSEFMVELVAADISSPEAQNNDSVKDRFWRKMHLLMNDYAELSGKEPEEVKETVKKELIDSGVIKSSTKELDLKGLAKVCNMLDEMIKNYGN